MFNKVAQCKSASYWATTHTHTHSSRFNDKSEGARASWRGGGWVVKNHVICVILKEHKVKVKSLSRVRLCDPMDCSLPCFSVHEIFQARVLGVGYHCLPQRIFLIQGSNQCLPHCRQTLYCFSQQGSHSLVPCVLLHLGASRCPAWVCYLLSGVRLFVIPRTVCSPLESFVYGIFKVRSTGG